MSQAGYLKREFPFSQRHSTYLQWAIAAQKQRDATVGYWGYRIDDASATPDVGDLVGYARDSKKKMTRDRALTYFDRTGGYESHSDIVVARRPGEIDVIGGNVLDSVTKKTPALDAAGKLIDAQNFWFVVLKRR